MRDAASKIWLENIPDKDKNKALEAVCMTYPTWFLEAYVSFEGKPLILEPFQINFLNDDSAFRICNKCRQTGGSMQVAMDKFFRSYQLPAYRCDIISINLKEATDKIKYIRNFWDSLPAKLQLPLTTDNALSIGFHRGSKKSVVHSLAASAGVRGGKKELFFDEFGHIVNAEELFFAAAPAILNGDLNLDIVSTPLGDQNLFAKIFTNAVDPTTGRRPYEMFSRHKFIWLDVKRFVVDGLYEEAQHMWKVVYGENLDHMHEMVANYGNERIQFFYHLYPWDQFLQEFCGVFLADKDAYFTWDLILRSLKGELGKVETEGAVFSEDFLEKWLERPRNNDNAVFVGVDWAEGKPSGDETSIQVVEKLPNGRFMHRASIVLRGDKYRENFHAQIADAAKIIAPFRPTKVICDHTSLGIHVSEDLRRQLPQFAFELVDFTWQNKTEMAVNMKSLMEQGNLWIQADDRALQGQLHSIQREITKHGVTRFYGEPHDDMFWALAMALKGGAYTPFVIYQIGGAQSRWGG